jgi:hypothetical protein
MWVFEQFVDDVLVLQMPSELLSADLFAMPILEMGHKRSSAWEHITTSKA